MFGAFARWFVECPTTLSSRSLAMSEAVLQTTALNSLHTQLGAKMVAFAGYSMPVSYPAGINAEHRHCRSAAALFERLAHGPDSLDW